MNGYKTVCVLLSALNFSINLQWSANKQFLLVIVEYEAQKRELTLVGKNKKN